MDKQNNNENQSKEDKKVTDESEDNKDASMDSSTLESTTTSEFKDSDITKCIELAKNLLADWSTLKEVFRIPKKERIEQMKEHEREAGKSVVCTFKQFFFVLSSAYQTMNMFFF